MSAQIYGVVTDADTGTGSVTGDISGMTQLRLSFDSRRIKIEWGDETCS